jgi:hypothetical protein
MELATSRFIGTLQTSNLSNFKLQTFQTLITNLQLANVTKRLPVYEINPKRGTRNTEHGTRNTEHGTRNTERGTRNVEQTPTLFPCNPFQPFHDRENKCGRYHATDEEQSP